MRTTDPHDLTNCCTAGAPSLRRASSTDLGACHTDLRFRGGVRHRRRSSLSNFGLPDLGLVGQSEMVEHISRLREATDLPLIVDADTGFGGAVNVFRTIQRYEKAGAAAIELEDHAFPKRCGSSTRKELINVQVFCARYSALASKPARTSA